jgi:hypothetical protein
MPGIYRMHTSSILSILQIRIQTITKTFQRRDMANPKTHDPLAKWLIASFIREFFAHYFPNRKIGRYTFLDKEFISKYEALKESIKDDLFILMEVEIEGIVCEVFIQIEHKSDREDVSMRLFEYFCYAWLLKKRPVWSIAFYTDDAVWRKKVPDSFWYAFSEGKGKQHCHFDVIKVKDEKSSDLMKKHSLLCKLLALKADDRGVDREELIKEIYRDVVNMKEELNNDRKLLIAQWIDAYSGINQGRLEQIKKEENMSYVATTISEHYINEGIIIGEGRGKLEGSLKTL